jgi:hypothetical protein
VTYGSLTQARDRQKTLREGDAGAVNVLSNGLSMNRAPHRQEHPRLESTKSRGFRTWIIARRENIPTYECPRKTIRVRGKT